MKKLLLLFFIFLALTAGSTYSQITNLKVMGGTTSFNINSGENFGWSFNVPKPGDTTLVQIWIDADQNGLLDRTKDVLWTFFNHIDGDPQGQNGPPDMDGNANGAVAFQMPLGLAPAHYIILFRNHGHYATATGVVNHLASPAYTISGTVTVPSGMSKKNLVLSLEGDGSGGSKMFWDAVTDENGNYTIEMNADTAGAPWYVRPNNSFVMGSAALDPESRYIRFIPGVTAYTGKNFTFTASSATVSGKLLYDNGTPAIGSDIAFYSGTGTFFYRNGRTDTAGFYRIGLMASELPQSAAYISGHIRDEDKFLVPQANIMSLKAGENITRNLTIYKPNATISGKVLIDGHAPNFPVQLYCTNMDTAYARDVTSDNAGNFTFNVSTKIFGYYIGPSIYNPTGGSVYNYTGLYAHAGDKNLTLNLYTTTGVKKDGSNAPSEYSLSQNYPNPFNPTTTISYAAAKEGFVSLTVYNLLGSKVATLVSENKPAGRYTVQFDGSSLSSGIYLYRLEAGSFVSIKKLVLMK